MRARTALVAGFLALAVAAPAQAATVSAGPTGDVLSANDARFTAAPGEVNALTVSVVATSFTPEHSGSPYDVLIRDSGAPVTAGDGCSAVDEHAALCQLVATVAIATADGDDTVDVSGVPATIATGAGADRVEAPTAPPVAVDAGDGDDVIVAGGDLHGGAGDDRIIGPGSLSGDAGDDVLTGPTTESADGLASLDGGPGDDRLSAAGTLVGGAGNDTLTGSPLVDSLEGGPGDDVLAAGAGNDELDGDGNKDGATPAPGAPGDDRIDGGPGKDTLTNANHRGGVAIDLAAGTARGPHGERDRLAGIENVTGSAGPDRIAGDGAANLLDGGRGKDVVDGRGGADHLTGGGDDTVRDRIVGGAGADFLHGGRHDTLACGGGADAVLDYAPSTTAGGDCERIDAAGDGWNASVHLLRRGSVLARAIVRCGEPCHGTITIRARGATLASTRLSGSRRHPPPPATLRVTPAGRGLLARPGRLAAELRVRVVPLGIDSGLTGLDVLQLRL